MTKTHLLFNAMVGALLFFSMKYPTLSIGAEPQELPLVHSGKAAARVVIARDELLEELPQNIPSSWNPKPRSVEEAALDLIEHVRLITGATLELQKVSAPEAAALADPAAGGEQTVILLGSLAMERLGTRSPEMERALEDPSGFVVKAGAGTILIGGRTPTAVSCGVHAVLERFGMRWFFPGPLGTVIPQSEELHLKAGEWCERPTFKSRYFQITRADEWMKRMRMGGFYFPPGSHGLPLGADAGFEARPDLYALVNGERIAKQHCISNPEVLSRTIASVKATFRKYPDAPWFGMGPNDGGGFCQCSGCTALDGGDLDPFFPTEVSVTDRYIWFFNQVLKGIGDEFPDKKIGFYVYHTYLRPPVKNKPDPRIVPAIAPIGLCRVHGLNNPVCPERSYLKGIIEAWSKLLPEVYMHGYWYNLADPGMLFIQTHRMRDEIPYYATQGITGFRTECNSLWAVQGPSLYLAAKLMWNAQADPDAILRDFCRKLFGPAEQPMLDYFELLDRQMRDADHHTGSAFNLLQYYPAPVRAKAAALMAKAKALAVESPYAERVGLFGEGFAYAEAFAQMLEARNRHDWEAAQAQLNEMDRLYRKLAGYEPPMLSGVSKKHLDRFFRHPVEQGYQRSSGGNRLVVALEDQWDFLTDPQQIGEALGYERAGLRGGNWQRVPTWSSTWSDLGLRYYRGLAWYRQSIDVPEEFAGRRVFLWFGGVDESARVWINGQLIGTSSTSAFTPFELDATPALRAGRNEVTVCVGNRKTDELGTGGIIAPAFFYAPEKGMKAQLENMQPLRETFP
ncbi:MAG TPA: DUF4838 domain-containing protein [Chthoniobacteraceae bacterium]|nr:DUF4838 domain-containing protein [Chthoniobacteraceae bacterium]